MKKLRPMLCLALLSTVLAGNALASEVTVGGYFSFFDSIVNAFVSLSITGSDGGCEGRQCQTCKPREEGGGGNCKPTP